MAKAVKIFTWIAVAFVIYSVVSSPDRSAQLVQDGFEGLSSAVKSVGRFFTQLLN